MKNLWEYARKAEKLQSSFETTSPDYTVIVIFNEVGARGSPFLKKESNISVLSFHREQLIARDEGNSKDAVSGIL